MLDEHDAVAGVHQSVQDADQAFHVGHVQAQGGLGIAHLCAAAAGESRSSQ
jgi:hypothetical protein